MIIKNKTNQIQELSVLDRNNRSLVYSIYIKSRSELSLDKELVILNLKTLLDKNIISVVDEGMIDSCVWLKEDNIPDDTPVEDEFEDLVVETEDTSSMKSSIPEDITGTPVEDSVVEAETPDNLICPECKKEFASARSLNMHINKSHKE